MMRCGLVGRKLSHSYSPQLHARLGDYSYELFELEPEALESFFTAADFDGVNVTIPYKQSVIPFCSRLDASAEKIGAVNTVVRENGALVGYNTDYFGFATLLDSLCDVAGKKVLVLGSGGASRTVCAVIADRGGQSVVLSRSGAPGHRYSDVACHHADAQVIVNATPVGMYPDTAASPLSLAGFPKLEAVIDLIYNPARTRLLLEAQRLHIPCANGLLMLCAQAELASALFQGKKDIAYRSAAICRELRMQQENILLVGMPGCGKTTVAKALCRLTGQEWLDSDAEIARLTGRTPEQIITEEGEATFRQMESRVLQSLCSRSSLVIATGGGAVTVPENRDILRQNGAVIWLTRPLSALATEGRPLSRGDLAALYEARKPLYEAVCDAVIPNDADPEAVAQRILQWLQERKAET